ncbi:MAG: 1-acyl-sn-glycerol-3-phosphate acyltransferase [Armatimonadetes bacterium]|nr:1-acyl-sn-glycerol-3-phosphate acyltransferase [Armatimonadota bacterium]
MLYPLLRFLGRWLARAAFGVCGGIRAEGREHVPATGGVLFTPNHISDSDPLAVFWACPRPAWFMAKEELFSIPALGPFIRLFRAFPVKRDSADRTALRRAEEILGAGECLVVFPEGRISETGAIQPIQPGVALIALRTGVPVVPVAVRGTNRVLPYGRLLPRRGGRVTVTFGTPLSFADLKGKRGATATAAERIAAAIAALLGVEPPPIAGQASPASPPTAGEEPEAKG